MALDGILVASGASIALNTSYVLQHGGLVSAPELHAQRPVESLRSLLRSRRWLSGTLLGYLGLAFELFAMTLAPLWVVQCVLAVGLVVVLGVWSNARGRPGSASMLPAALLLGAGLFVLALTGAGGRAGVTAGPLALGGLGIAAATLAAAVLARHDVGGAARNGIAAGVLYGATTIGFAAVITALRAPVLDGWLIVTAATLAISTTIGGFCCFQRGLQAGEPIAVVTTMTAGMNAVAIAGGLLLGGSTGVAGVTLVVEGLGLLAICASGAVAARALSVPQV